MKNIDANLIGFPINIGVPDFIKKLGFWWFIWMTVVPLDENSEPEAFIRGADRPCDGDCKRLEFFILDDFKPLSFLSF